MEVTVRPEARPVLGQPLKGAWNAAAGEELRLSFGKDARSLLFLPIAGDAREMVQDTYPSFVPVIPLSHSASHCLEAPPHWEARVPCLSGAASRAEPPSHAAPKEEWAATVRSEQAALWQRARSSPRTHPSRRGRGRGQDGPTHLRTSVFPFPSPPAVEATSSGRIRNSWLTLLAFLRPAVNY